MMISVRVTRYFTASGFHYYIIYFTARKYANANMMTNIMTQTKFKYLHMYNLDFNTFPKTTVFFSTL